MPLATPRWLHGSRRVNVCFRATDAAIRMAEMGAQSRSDFQIDTDNGEHRQIDPDCIQRSPEQRCCEIHSCDSRANAVMTSNGEKTEKKDQTAFGLGCQKSLIMQA